MFLTSSIHCFLNSLRVCWLVFTSFGDDGADVDADVDVELLIDICILS